MLKSQILKLIASSKNSYELADRICELVEKEMRTIIGEQIDKDFGYGYIYVNGKRYLEDEEGIVILNEFIKEMNKKLSKSLHSTSPDDSRRDVGKGK